MRPGTYVYCLVAAPRVPSLNRIRRGPAGLGPVRLLAVEDTAPHRRVRSSRAGARAAGLRKWLVVADAPASQYNEAAINRRLSDVDWVSRAAVAHERVVERFTDQPAVLPMKLFTIFTSDERALEHVKTDSRRVNAVVNRVAGCQEWGVRLLFDVGRARGSQSARRKTVASGTAYLSLKKAQSDRAAEAVGRAREVVADLYDRLDRLSVASKRRSASELAVDGRSVLMDGAFLVPHRRVRQFHAAAGRESKALERQGYRVTVSGPWPPYSFVQD